MCNWLIQETHPKSVLVFKRWTYYMIQQYLMQGSINGYDAFSVHRCINMHMYMQMCAIRGIYVGIHVHVRECFILEELCTVSVLHSQNNLLGIIDIGAHKPQYMASSPLCQVLYISCILALPLCAIIIFVYFKRIKYLRFWIIILVSVIKWHFIIICYCKIDFVIIIYVIKRKNVFITYSATPKCSGLNSGKFITWERGTIPVYIPTAAVAVYKI